MKLLWTKSPNAVDWLINLVTAEDCGHFAILFESVNGTGVVFESNLLGTHPAFYKTWMGTSRKIIHSIDVVLTAEQEDKIWDLWVNNFDGHGYDFFGCIYVGLMKLRKRIFKKEIPTKNIWSKNGAFFCDVIYQVLDGIQWLPDMKDQINEMSSPHDLFLFVSQNIHLIVAGAI